MNLPKEAFCEKCGESLKKEEDFINLVCKNGRCPEFDKPIFIYEVDLLCWLLLAIGVFFVLSLLKPYLLYFLN